MSYTYSNELAHFGIPGMKWGIRRYQNEDGTLTPEGRERYNAGDPKVVKAIDEANAQRTREKEVKSKMTRTQRNMFNAMHKNAQQKMLNRMSKGDDWGKAYAKTSAEYAAKGALVGMGTYIALSYINPVTRPYAKHTGKLIASYGKAVVRSIKNSNAVQRGALYLNKLKRTSGMKRNGGVVLGKKDFDIRDIPFGGFLGR